jgi:hypothetical protein
MPHIGYSGRSLCYSVAVRPYVHMAYGASEASEAEAPIARVLAWANTNGAGPQREGALRNVPGALSSALERGSASKSRMVSLYTSTCEGHRTPCSGHEAHDTVAKVRHEGSVADPRGKQRQRKGKGGARSEPSR